MAPFFTSATVNRGLLLERAWKRDRRLAAKVDPENAEGSPALLGSWSAKVASGACPGAVFNAMVAETGEPMLFSTAPLPPELQPFEFRRHYAKLDVTLTTAVRLSAAFPYVSPATRAQHDSHKEFWQHVGDGHHEPRFNHIVDGGYFDNFGIATAAEWLEGTLAELKERAARDPGIKLPARVLLLEICEEGTWSSTPGSDRPALGGEQKTLAYQTYAPLSALFQMRSAAQRTRNRWHVSLLRQTWSASNVTIESARFAYPRAAGPMSWHLTGNQKNEIACAWRETPIVGQRDQVARFVSGTDDAHVESPPPCGQRTPASTPAPGPLRRWW